MQTQQTHIFFRKARVWIKRIVLATLAVMALLVAITSFLLSPWAEPWLIYAFKKVIAQQQSVHIEFKRMHTAHGSCVCIDEVHVKSQEDQPLVYLDQVNLHFSILQLLHGSLPIERIEIPNALVYAPPLTTSSDQMPPALPSHFSLFEIDIPFWMLSANMRLDIGHIAIEKQNQSSFSLHSLIRWNPIRRYLELDLIERTDTGSQPQIQLRLSQFFNHASIELEGLQLHQSMWMSPSLRQAWPASTFLLELEGSLEDWSQKNQESEFPCRLQGKLTATIEGDEALFLTSSSEEKNLTVGPALFLKSRFTLEDHWKIFTKKIQIQGWGLTTSGKLTFDIPASSFQFSMEGPFTPMPAFTPGMDWHTSDFKIDIGGELHAWKGAFELQAKKLDLTHWNEPLSQAKAEAAVSYDFNQGLEINGNIQATYEEKPINIDLITRKSEEGWHLQELQVESQGMDLSVTSPESPEEKGWYLRANLGLEPSLISQILLRRFNLQAGALEFFAHWEQETQTSTLTNVDFDVKLQELNWNSWRVQSTEASGRVALLPHKMNDFTLESLSLEAKHIEHEDQLICNRFQSHGWGNAEAIFFQLHLGRQSQFSGSDIPYDLSSEGLLGMDKGCLRLSLKELKGSWSQLPLKMEKSTLIEIAPHKISCDNLDLELGEGKLQLAGHFSNNQVSLSASCTKVPVNMVSLLIGRPLWGLATGSFSIEANDQISKGDLFLNLQSLRTESQANPSEDITSQLTCHWKGEDLKFDGSLYTPHQHLQSSIKGTWQALENPSDWHKIALDKKHDLSIDLSGKLGLFSHLFTDEIFDFDGNAEVHFHTVGTPRHPQIEGRAEVLNGSFDHYAIGLKIRDITCHLHGENDTIVLDELQANDGSKGQMSAEGTIHLTEDIQSQTTLSFQHFCFIQTPLTWGVGTGKGYFNYSGFSARLGGEFELEKASIKIPDLLPQSIPEFHDYTIIRKPGRHTLSPSWITQSQEGSDKKEGFIPGVISFDLTLKIPSGLILEGRGLQSSWLGEVKLLGHHEQPQLLGHMSLKEGDFRFGNRRFIVKEGEVNFAGQPLQDTQLRIASETTIDQVTIRATLTGPLAQPRLQFNATPNLSLADLFSHVLFGKSYNSLSAFQGLQVAQLALETSGTANTDAFTQLRKKTGVDRFDIASKKPGAAELTDEDIYTVKLGKYVADGFLIGINKNVSEEGTQLTLEVDLTDHFSLITEIGYLDDSSLNLMWKKEY